MRWKTVSIAFVVFFAATVMLNACSNLQAEKEQKIALLEKYTELWNTGNFDGITDVIAEDFELKFSHLNSVLIGEGDLINIISAFRRDYQDLYVEVLDVCIDGDEGATRYAISATNNNGVKIKGDGVSYLYFSDGKISKIWSNNNDLSWNIQEGMVLVWPEEEIAPE
jgi:hypothetical protein